MDDILDLTCSEVIDEEFIEPHGPSSSYVEGEDGVSRYCTRSRTKVGETNDGGVQVRKDKVGRKLMKRRQSGSKNLKVAKQKLSVIYEDPMHSVLPEEVRWSILKQIEFSELFNLRAVSSKWKGTIDSMLKVNVRIDGESKDFSGKCGLSIKACKLVTLQNPAHRHLFKSPLPEELELCWRTLMKNLLFGRSASECSVALRKRELLPNLTILKIEVLTYDDLGERSKSRIFSNLATLTSYDYPSLKKCSMTFVGYRQLHAENRYLAVLLSFLAGHSETLDTLTFTLKYANHVVYPPAQPRHILFCVPANLKISPRPPHNATDSQLITTQLKKLDQSPEHHLEWVHMLNDKRKLEVAIMTRFLNWTIKHLDFFTPTIKQYSKFIYSIELMNITMYDSGAHNTVTQLDLKIFQQCPQLAHLRLYRAPIIFHEDEVDPTTELINFPDLPKTLQEIVVDGLPVSSNEILITIGQLGDLRTFHYFQSQVPRRNTLWTNGVSWEVLQQIIKHPKLTSVKVHVTSIGQVRDQYEEPLRTLCHKYGWNRADIATGYMNMYQVTLSKCN